MPQDMPDREEQTAIIVGMMETLHNMGCAVAVWTPEELGEDIAISGIEEAMIESGREYIGSCNPANDTFNIFGADDDRITEEDDDED